MADNDYLKAAVKLEQFVSGALDGQVKSLLIRKGLIAGVCMAVPLWGIETIIYAFVLWSTYSSISDMSGVPFRRHLFKNIFGGILINVLVTLALGCALDFIPVVGWIGSFAVGYISLYISSMGYVKMLKTLHGKDARLDINTKKGLEAMNKNSSTYDSDVRKFLNQ